MRRITRRWIGLALVGWIAACSPRPSAPAAVGSPVPPDATPAADPALQATPVSLATSTAAPSAPAGLATSTLAAISADAPRARPLLEGINVRGGPGIDYEVIAMLRAGETAAVLGRTLAGDWYAVQTDAGLSGWVAANVVELLGVDPATIAVVANIPALPTAPATAAPLATLPPPATDPPADDQPPPAPPTQTLTPNPLPTDAPTDAPPPTVEVPPTVNPYP
ncbi:exported protein of unknown function [Candidatus Promineifilum breve]|uniref:SH3b domain-containing protein n=1 Tax=Candidatus Promineifilum breve TaxID=1806508 RepID=A0A160T5R1_9CHLR|nr:SH3 domain-containing protein [Candidatus Promineifilum breve]CUS05721.1 exported protein of unknown function [Candidatus Promineifilum breve]